MPDVLSLVIISANQMSFLQFPNNRAGKAKKMIFFTDDNVADN